MPEFHPGTDVEIASNIPQSAFRNAIKNVKRYTAFNKKDIRDVAEAAMKGDYDTLEELLSTGNEKTLFNGDLNEHLPNGFTTLHWASSHGQTECIELLLQAGADPHMKERVPQGRDPEDGRTALEMAQEAGYDDIVDLLAKAEADTAYGYYLPAGPENNRKIYGDFQWGVKPEKGWFMGRPGVAKQQGIDPAKYGYVERDTRIKSFKYVKRGAPPASIRVLKSEEAPPLRIAETTATAGTVNTSPKSSPKPVEVQEVAPEVAPVEVQEVEPEAASLAPVPTELPCLPVALLFPGQGSQYVNMMQEVKDLPKVQEMLRISEKILGYDLLELCLNGPEEKLEETRYCQPVMFVAGLAGVEKLRLQNEELVSRLMATAGLSLGEYTALCTAGVFTFEDGLRLVQLRGEAMQKAASIGKQGMISIAGLSKKTVETLCADALKVEENGVCMIANELFHNGFSCSGTEKSIMKLKELAEAASAMQARVLKTSGAFHTELMESARKTLAEALDEILPRMKSPRCKIYMNVNAKPIDMETEPRVIVEMLNKQLTSSVLWEPTVKAMIKDGVMEFYEVGPMKQLKAMMKRIDPSSWKRMQNVEV